MTALVLLPGMDGTGDMFAGFIAALGPECKTVVIAYPENQALDYQALEAFVRPQLPHDEPFILLGESFAGPLAISLAASRPPDLAGLVLCCTFDRNPQPLLRPLKTLTGILPVSSQLSRLLSFPMFGRHASIELRQALKQALQRVSACALRTRLRAVMEVDVSHKLKEIQVPILYLQAAQDRIVPPAALRHLRMQKPEIKVEVLQGAHLLLQIAPLETASIIKHFMTKLQADRRN